MPRTGSQEPTFCQEGAFRETDGAQAALLASAFFGEPMEWQRRVLDGMLARDGADRYMFHTVGLSVPRQNGKSWNVRARCFYGIVTMGERVLYTCQHGDTADEMFKALSAPFEDEDNTELHGMLQAVRKTNGQQAIYLANGGLVRFTTRTNSLARGKSYDVLIYDEAQELTRAQQAASLPTISASKRKNTQTIYIGTPPDPTAPGEVFRPLHDRVHRGEAPSALWYEWAADGIKDASDREWWYRCNPSLGLLVGETAIEGEAESFAPDDFARERLGWWDTSAARFDAAIGADAWAACGAPSPPSKDAMRGGKTAFGVKFDPQGDRAAVAVCLAPAEGLPFVELVDVHSMPGQLAALSGWLTERLGMAAEIAIDGKSYASELARLLSQGGASRGQVRVATANEICAAAQMFAVKIADGDVAHIATDGQDALSASVAGCARRRVGSAGAWALGDGIERSCEAEAASLALYASQVTKRDPEGGLKIW